jgi:uncharacterized protein
MITLTSYGAMIPPRTYIPEIHDVHPGMECELDRLLAALPVSARSLSALLVVPDWGGRHPLDAHPAFVSRLRDFPGMKVLHGLTHSLGHDGWNRIFYGTENHAEFAALSAVAARDRLTMAIMRYQEAFQKSPSWFCAPRWQQNAAVRRTLAEMGFEGYMLGSRYEKVDGTRLSVPAICFDDGGHAWRHAAGRVQRGFQIRRWLAAGTPFRLTLHPNDLSDPQTWAQATGLITALEENGWQPLAFNRSLFG